LQKDLPPDEDPSKDIIGKWELVAEEQEGNRIVPLEPDGYIEYLANGELISFIASENRFGEIRTTYQIDSVYLYEYIDADYPHFVYEYVFINEDKLKLKEVSYNVWKILYPYFRIYQRIKE
jgi:hypothetical protein